MKCPEITYESDLVIVRDTGRYGFGLFAKIHLLPSVEIVRFDGPIYSAPRASYLPNEPPLFVRDRAIQISETSWQDSCSPARFACHSCNPNAGIKARTILVAMREIEVGEEITFDYDMTEDSDWEMTCLCGDPECRKQIRGHRFLPREKAAAYGSYVSDWLLKKYSLKSTRRQTEIDITIHSERKRA